MDYVLFGGSGLRVSELCLGAMNFGTEWAYGVDQATSRAVFDAYAEAGGNFIDTACTYNRGASETIVGDLIQAERDHFVVATKYTSGLVGGDIIQSGNSRKNLYRSVGESLKRLRTDYIDVLYLHHWDFTTAMEEVLRGLDDIVRAGLVRYVAVSNAPAWIIARADLLARTRGWSPFIGMQIPYSLMERTSERELLPMADALDLGVCAWSPLANGVLAGKYSDADDKTDRDGVISPAERHMAQLVGEIAKTFGATSAQVALAWVRQQQPVPIIAIVSADNADQMQGNIASLDLTLPADALAQLDAASRIELGYPYQHLHMDVFRNMATAFHADRLRPARRPRF